MLEVKDKPDIFWGIVPGYRWGLNWDTNINFDLKGKRKRIKEIMKKYVDDYQPIPIVFMIDHPKPFFNFVNLPDARQAIITEYLAELSWEVGANFIFRSYSKHLNKLGNNTKRAIIRLCKKANREFICPGK